MRTVTALSPTSIKLFYENKDEFYVKYLADNRPPRIPQTRPMSVGSAFDAFVKSYLVERLVGKASMEPQYELQTLFETQVEPQNRDWAYSAGQYCFDCYKKYGSLHDLMVELEQAAETPRFELSIEGRISHTNNVGIPLTGKPDVFFRTKDKAPVVLDWKVNGYCSQASPAKGYIMLRGETGRGLNAPHKDATIMQIMGLPVNVAMNLEQVKEDWAQQLAIYSWVLGVPVGEQCITGIDQLACDSKVGIWPSIRVARHRNRISPEFQINVFNKACIVWDTCQSDHFFQELSLEESKAKCSMLDQRYLAFGASDDPKEAWFQSITRG